MRGRTVGEFGAGNYPLDMVVYRKDGKDKLLIANSNLPFLIVDPKTSRPTRAPSTNTSRPTSPASATSRGRATGVLQMDNLGTDHVSVLRRLPGGRLDLVPLSVRRF